MDLSGVSDVSCRGSQRMYLHARSAFKTLQLLCENITHHGTNLIQLAPLQIRNEIARMVIWQRSRPASANASDDSNKAWGSLSSQHENCINLAKNLLTLNSRSTPPHCLLARKVTVSLLSTLKHCAFCAIHQKCRDDRNVPPRITVATRCSTSSICC